MGRRERLRCGQEGFWAPRERRAADLDLAARQGLTQRLHCFRRVGDECPALLLIELQALQQSCRIHLSLDDVGLRVVLGEQHAHSQHITESDSAARIALRRLRFVHSLDDLVPKTPVLQQRGRDAEMPVVLDLEVAGLVGEQFPDGRSRG